MVYVVGCANIILILSWGPRVWTFRDFFLSSKIKQARVAELGTRSQIIIRSHLGRLARVSCGSVVGSCFFLLVFFFSGFWPSTGTREALRHVNRPLASLTASQKAFPRRKTPSRKMWRKPLFCRRIGNFRPREK